MSEKNQKPLSVVVPIYNEEENVVELHNQILSALKEMDHTDFEVIFVDDGSSDATYEKCLSLSPLTIIKLRKNFGQTAAFDAGFKAATGDVIVTLDGDLQNDPRDIPALLEKLNEGVDVVSGWRKKRKDTLSKKITSRTANLLRKVLFNDTIHDSGCALKAYRRECFENLDLYGEMHRFIPAILETHGFKIGEVPVNHRPRLHGKSKYGNLKRGLKSLTDMISVWFWGRYSARPLHIFGSFGIFVAALGTFILVLMATLKIFFDIDLAERIWPLVGVFLVLSGTQLFTIGIVTDLLSKVYYKSHGHMNYSIASIQKNG